jgi:hypothetical protein
MRDERVALRQRRDLSQIIEAAATLYLQNLALFFTIAAVVVPLGIAGAVFQTAIENDIAALVVVSIVNVAQAAVSLLVGAAIVAAIADIDAGRQPDFSRAYDAAFARFWTLLGAILRVVAVVLLLAITIVGIPWAIRQGIRWLFVEQAVILEGKNASDALRLSSDTVIGSWWRTFGISLLIGIIAGVPAGIVAALFSLAPVLVSGTVSAVVSAALLPFAAIATTLLYFDLRARKAETAEFITS